MLSVQGAGNNRQVRMMLAHMVHQCVDLFLFINRNDQQLGLMNSGRMKQIGTCGVAVKHLETE